MNRNLCGIAAHWYGKAAAQGDEEAGARPCEPATATSTTSGAAGARRGALAVVRCPYYYYYYYYY